MALLGALKGRSLPLRTLKPDLGATPSSPRVLALSTRQAALPAVTLKPPIDIIASIPARARLPVNQRRLPYPPTFRFTAKNSPRFSTAQI